jgi:hypothetical protein
VATSVSVVVAALLVTALSAPAQAANGSQKWVARFGGPGNDNPNSIVTSPDGRAVYATGTSSIPGASEHPFSDAVTVAYDAASGGLLWASRFVASEHGIPSGTSQGVQVLASPDGTAIYVGLLAINGNNDLSEAHTVVVAYSAASGQELWVSDSPAHYPRAMALAPDGASLAVAGFDQSGAYTQAIDTSDGAGLWSISSFGPTSQPSSIAYVPGRGSIVEALRVPNAVVGGDEDVAWALDASNGRTLWAKSLGIQTNGGGADYVAVSPDGSGVYVGMDDDTAGARMDIVTDRLDPATGSIRWSKRFNGTRRLGQDQISGIAVSPSGNRVFITGLDPAEFATIAYRASSGAEIWRTDYDGGGSGPDIPMAIALSPKGAKVYVLGRSPLVGDDLDFATVAYSAADGSQLWASRYGSVGRDNAVAMAVSPTGSGVFVIGSSIVKPVNEDWFTVAYVG